MDEKTPQDNIVNNNDDKITDKNGVSDEANIKKSELRRDDMAEIEKNFEVENSTIFTSQQPTQTKAKAAKKDKTEGGVASKSSSVIKGIAALLAVAIVMTGTMFALKYLWPVSNSSASETTTGTGSIIDLTASANVELKDMKNVPKSAISNVSKIEISNTNGKLEVVPEKLVKTTTTDESGNSSTDETVQYKVVGFDNIPQNNSTISSMVSNILSVKAIKQLQGDWTDKDCGLDKPAISVNVTMANGSKFSYSVGNTVPDGNNCYYAKTSLKDGIYIVNTEYFDDFNTTINDYVDTTLVTALTASGENDSYFSNSTLVKYESIDISGTHVQNPIKMAYKENSSEALVYRITSPVLTYADDSKVSSLLAPISSGMSAAAALKVNPTAADLKKYGLDKPYFQIKYVVKGEKYNIKISKPDIITEGYYCCTINDVPVVYSLMKDLYEFIDWDLGDIRSSILYVRNIEKIDKMTIAFGGKSTLYDISYDKVQTTTSAETTTVAADSTQSTTAAADDYKINVVSNAATVDAESFKVCYSHLILVRPFDYLKAGESAPTGTPTLTITCKNTDGSTDVLKFIKYNSRYYSYTINGVGDALIRYDTLNSLINDYKTLQSGKTVSDD